MQKHEIRVGMPLQERRTNRFQIFVFKSITNDLRRRIK